MGRSRPGIIEGSFGGTRGVVVGWLQLDHILRGGLSLLLPFVTSEEHPAHYHEEKREDDDSDAETNDGAIVRFWVGMVGYRGLDGSVRGRWRVDWDSGLDGGGGWAIWWMRGRCGCVGLRRFR